MRTTGAFKKKNTCENGMRYDLLLLYYDFKSYKMAISLKDNKNYLSFDTNYIIMLPLQHYETML